MLMAYFLFILHAIYSLCCIHFFIFMINSFVFKTFFVNFFFTHLTDYQDAYVIFFVHPSCYILFMLYTFLIFMIISFNFLKTFFVKFCFTHSTDYQNAYGIFSCLSFMLYTLYVVYIFLIFMIISFDFKNIFCKILFYPFN